MNKDIKKLPNGDFKVIDPREELYQICTQELGRNPSDKELTSWLVDYAIKLRENYNQLEFMLRQKLIS